MRARLLYVYGQLNASFWFWPLVIIALFVCTAIAAIFADGSALADELRESGWVYHLQADGARSVVSTVTGAMMTVASLVFSLTLVALTLAAGNMGPRVIDEFLQDRLSQVVLGWFLGVFAYGLLVSITIGGNTDDWNLPVISISLAILSTLTSLVLLVSHVHHVARMIQSDNVLAKLGAKLVERVLETFPEPGASNPADRDKDGVERFGEVHHVHADSWGYVQTVDAAGLTETAKDNDALIEMNCRAGAFIVEPALLATIWTPLGFEGEQREELDAAVRRGVVLGKKRTDVQDFEFTLRNISEIGQRALSPSLNDFYTATTAIDQLINGLSIAARRDEPPAVKRDENGAPRVLLDRPSFKQLLSSAFQDLWQCSRGNAAASVHLLEALRALALCLHREEDRAALKDFADVLGRAVEVGFADIVEQGRFGKALAALHRALESSTETETKAAETESAPGSALVIR